jgi:hypothetical protein
MGTRPQTGIDHGFVCVKVRTGAVQHDWNILKRLFNSLRVVQVKDPALNT